MPDTRPKNPHEALIYDTLLGIAPEDRQFPVEDKGTTFHVFHTHTPPPIREVTLAVVIPDKEHQPLVVAVCAQGWLEEEEVLAEIRNGRNALN